MSESSNGMVIDSPPLSAPVGGQVMQQTMTRHSGAMQIMKPRTLAAVQRRLTEEAMLASERFFYGWGAGKEKIEGASIKCALAVARCYGNCSVEMSPVQEVGDSWIFTANFIDHETGFTLSRQFRQSKNFIVYGKHDEYRKADIRFQIGQSKAIRNVVLNAVPIGLVDGAIEAAKSQVGVKLDAWIAKCEAKEGGGKPGSGIVFAVDYMLKGLAKFGASEPRVLSKLEIADRKAIDRERLILLRANLSAMEDGEATADELFPKLEKEPLTINDVTGGNPPKTEVTPPDPKPTQPAKITPPVDDKLAELLKTFDARGGNLAAWMDGQGYDSLQTLLETKNKARSEACSALNAAIQALAGEGAK